MKCIIADEDDEEEFDEAFLDSALYLELSKLIDGNVNNAISLLPGFYRKGSRLGANDLRTHPEFNNRDQKALNILFDYNSELVRNVNVDSCLGIKDILFMGAVAGIGISKLTENILQSPYVMSKYSGATVSHRCTMITTTEYGRTVNTGVLQAYVNKGVYMVDIKTAGDDRVCDECIEIENNNPYTIEEAMNLIPVHSLCRCSIKNSNASLDPELTSDWVVNLTNNDYSFNDYMSNNSPSVEYTLNQFMCISLL